MKHFVGGGEGTGFAIADALREFREAGLNGGVMVKAVFEADGDKFVHPGKRLLAALGGEVAARIEMRVVGEDDVPNLGHTVTG